MIRRSLVVLAAALALTPSAWAAPDAGAPRRLEDLTGRSKAQVAALIGLGDNPAWTVKFAALDSGRRVEVLAFGEMGDSAACPGGETSVIPTPDLEGWHFVDDVLVGGIAAPLEPVYPPSPPNPDHLRLMELTRLGQANSAEARAINARIRASNEARRRAMGDVHRQAPRNPPGPLFFEQGIGPHLADLAARRASGPVEISVRCRPSLLAASARITVRNPAEALVTAVGMAYWSPFYLGVQADNADRARASAQAGGLLSAVALGAPVPGGPAAFARSNSQRVRWHASRLPGYGVLTLDLGGEKRAFNGGGDGRRFAVVGVRNGIAEWLMYDHSAGICLGQNGRPSSVRAGCTTGGIYDP